MLQIAENQSEKYPKEKMDSVTPEQVRRAMETHAHHVDFALLGKVEGVDTKLLESF